MLEALYMIETYFETPFSAMCEDEIKRLFDDTEINRHINDGHIERRCITPIKDEDRYYLYKLSEKGRRLCERKQLDTVRL